jgi:hypothetical protein
MIIAEKTKMITKADEIYSAYYPLIKEALIAIRKNNAWEAKAFIQYAP